jgi:hypothetical protein
MRFAAVIALAVALMLLACATNHDQLVRAQHAFEQNQHEQTLGLLRDLDPTSLGGPEQAQYAYLRGMTDYRIGYRADARHWLAFAKALDDQSPGYLPTEWKARLGEALDELSAVVYDEGFSALTNEKPKEK